MSHLFDVKPVNAVQRYNPVATLPPPVVKDVRALNKEAASTRTRAPDQQGLNHLESE